MGICIHLLVAHILVTPLDAFAKKPFTVVAKEQKIFIILNY